MKLSVDYNLCESNAVCVGLVPEVFELDDDDNLHVHQEHPAQELLERVREAVDSCPKRAISLDKTDD